MRIVFCFCLALLVVGCQSTRQSSPERNSAKTAPGPSNPQKTEIVPVQIFKGRVAFVNPAARFAVLDFFSSAIPPNEERLSVYRQGQKVGEVKISGPSRDHNTVADITAGEVQVGDTVQSE